MPTQNDVYTIQHSDVSLADSNCWCVSVFFVCGKKELKGNKNDAICMCFSSVYFSLGKMSIISICVICVYDNNEKPNRNNGKLDKVTGGCYIFRKRVCLMRILMCLYVFSDFYRVFQKKKYLIFLKNFLIPT